MEWLDKVHEILLEAFFNVNLMRINVMSNEPTAIERAKIVIGLLHEAELIANFEKNDPELADVFVEFQKSVAQLAVDFGTENNILAERLALSQLSEIKVLNKTIEIAKENDKMADEIVDLKARLDSFSY